MQAEGVCKYMLFFHAGSATTCENRIFVCGHLKRLYAKIVLAKKIKIPKSKITWNPSHYRRRVASVQSSHTYIDAYWCIDDSFVHKLAQVSNYITKKTFAKRNKSKKKKEILKNTIRLVCTKLVITSSPFPQYCKRSVDRQGRAGE